MLTSRSAIEEFQRCPRRRYLAYHYDGRGIVPVEPYVPFRVGTAVHKGIELLLRGQDIDNACEVALRDVPYHSDGYQDGEQVALSEALIRVANMFIVPWIRNQYDIVSIEQEELMELASDITLMSRCDLVVRDKSDYSVHIINFKTTSNHPTSDGRSEHAIYHTLQGITESMAMSHRLTRNKDHISLAMSKISACIDHFSQAGLHNLQEHMEKVLSRLKQLHDSYTTSVKSVRFVFLIKGATRWKFDDDGNRLYRVTYSPLVRAYQNSNGEFAHTYNLPNNKRLGKDWKPINVWETIGVKAWIDKLASGKVQPELGNILAQQVYVPYESYVKDWELHEVTGMILEQERNVMSLLERGIEAFPMYRHSCDYPTICPYQAICYGKEEDPIGSGKYQYRIPHHTAELEMIEDA